MPLRRFLLFLVFVIIPLLAPYDASAQSRDCCTNPGGRACGAECSLDDDDGDGDPDSGHDVDCYSGKISPCDVGAWRCYFDIDHSDRHGHCYNANFCPAPFGVCAVATPTTAPPPPPPPPLPTIPTDNFTPLRYPCRSGASPADPEFHPLRPYPGSPCDPLIPRKLPEAPDSDDPDNMYLTFMCGKSMNVSGTTTVKDVVRLCGILGPPDDGNWIGTIPSGTDSGVLRHCSTNSPDLCFARRITWGVHFDLSATQLPIMGNTQIPSMSDEQKVNNYLSWYLNGTILQSEHEPLDMSDPTNIKRVTTFSGPLNKLLPKDIQTNLRDTLREDSIPNYDIHNYIIETSSGTRISIAPDDLYKNISYSTLEDVTGEFTVSIIPANQPVSPDIDGTILSISMSINIPSDSRLYFPHMRAAVALSEILAALHKPLITPTPAVDSTDRQLVSQNITQHQGIADNTQVQGEDRTRPNIRLFNQTEIRHVYDQGNLIRNTEVREGYPAPTPLYAADPICDISNVRSNQGDTLKPGPTGTIKAVNATLTYVQLFRWTPQRLIGDVWPPFCNAFPCTPNLTQCTDPTNPIPCCRQGPCAHENDICDNADNECCWESCPYRSPCEHADAEFWCARDDTFCMHQGETPYYDLSCSPSHPGYTCCGPNPDDIYGCRGPGLACQTAFCDDVLHCGRAFPPPIGPLCYSCTWEIVEEGHNPVPDPPHCPVWPTRDLRSAARSNVFSKTPLIEKIYDILIVEPMSVLRRWLPKRPEGLSDADFLERGRENTIPATSVVRYSGSTENLDNTRVTGGRGGTGGIYFPHLGSLQNYFLGSGQGNRNLQCLLRPLGMCRALPPSGRCNGDKFAEIAPAPNTPTSQAISFFQTFILPNLTAEVIDAYQAAEDWATLAGYNVPCEVMAGIHFVEANNDPTLDFVGGDLNGRTLTEAAIQGAEELLAHACDTFNPPQTCPIPDINTLMRALSGYNGGGNSNCQDSSSCALNHNFTERCGSTTDCASDPAGCHCTIPFNAYETYSCRQICRDEFGHDPYPFPYPINYTGQCPPPTQGYDDAYVTNWWLSPDHDVMSILYMYDCTQSNPITFMRPGSLTVAITLFLTETGGL